MDYSNYYIDGDVVDEINFNNYMIDELMNFVTYFTLVTFDNKCVGFYVRIRKCMCKCENICMCKCMCKCNFKLNYCWSLQPESITFEFSPFCAFCTFLLLCGL